MLLPNPRGHYHFLSGIAPYSSGVIADPGYQIVHVTLTRLVPWRQGFELVDSFLKASQCERSALCAVELRSPAPFTRQGFVDFNQEYCRVLEEWDLLVEGRNPVARTNVAPNWNIPREVSLYGFSFTLPLPEAGRTFVVAGAGEMGGGSIMEAPVIRPGEFTRVAMTEKARHVMGILGKRLAGLGVTWNDVTTTEVYTIRGIEPFAGTVLLDGMGTATLHGLRWHHARPPIDELEFEMDARGVRQELYL